MIDVNQNASDDHVSICTSTPYIIYENKFPKYEYIKEKRSLLPVSDRWMSFGRLVSAPGSTREMSLSVRSRDSRLGNPSTRSDVTARK